MIPSERNTRLIWILGICLIAGLLSACNGRLKDPRTISGVLYDGATMAPIRGAQITLLQENGKDFPTTETEFQQTVTDSLGRYSIQFSPFKSSKATDIRIEAALGSVYFLSSNTVASVYPIAREIIGLDEVLEGDIQKDLLGKPYGKLTLQVYNDNPVNFADQATIRVQGDDYDYTMLLINTELNGDYTFFVKGNDLVKLSWMVLKGGLEDNFSDTISSRTNQEVFYRMPI